MFDISYNSRLSVKGSFKKIDNSTWQKLGCDRELISADNFGCVLRMKGWGKGFNCKIRVVPMNYVYSMEGKFAGKKKISLQDGEYFIVLKGRGLWIF